MGKSDGTFNGMPVKNISKSNSYKYLTYEQVLAKVNNIARGMIHKLNVDQMTMSSCLDKPIWSGQCARWQALRLVVSWQHWSLR